MPNAIKFEGFEPTSELRALAKELLWYLEGRSPSQSFATATLSKTAAKYAGTLEIAFNKGLFKTESLSLTAEECLQDLYSKALGLIKDWAFSRKLPSDI